MYKSLSFATFVLLGCAGLTVAGDEADAVKKAVLGPQEAGWARHDFKTYMTQWADEAQIVVGRSFKADKFDVTFTYKQIEATRRLLFSAKPAPGQKVVFENVQVTVDGKQAKLMCRNTVFFGADYEVADELYRLRKTADGWKVFLNRGWLVKSKHGETLTTYDAAQWEKLDEQAEFKKRADKRGDETAQALMAAFRFPEAHALLKKVTARDDATAGDWIARGHAAMAAGHADDGLASFRKALKLDEKAPVPPWVQTAGNQ